MVKYIYNSDSNGNKYWKSILIIEYTSGTIRITYFISLLELIKKIVDDLGWTLNISIELSGWDFHNNKNYYKLKIIEN